MVCDTSAEELLWLLKCPTGSTEAEQHHSAFTGSKVNHKHHQNTQPHIKAGIPAVVCRAAEFSQRHEVKRVRRHSYKTGITLLWLMHFHLNKTNVCFYASQKGLSPNTAPVCYSTKYSGSPLLGKSPATPGLGLT